ncbi:hypothetical protein [Streptomyces goshikiensis]|uniref:hypothetical protein n=1 Tax=Streptomyces goshikiensis TaxID=1942 RepID=UPI0036485846
MTPQARAWLCSNLVPLRHAAVRLGREADVESLVAEVRADPASPEDSRLDVLSRALGGPPVVVRGVGDLASGGDLGARLPGGGGGLPAQVTYRCPSLACARQGERTPGGPLPLCALSDEPMTMTAVTQ